MAHEGEPEPFEIQIEGEGTIALRLGYCAVALYRQEPDFDHVIVNDPEIIRIWNNQDFARWLGVYAIRFTEEGEIERPPVFLTDEEDPDDEPKTFRDLTGWNPMVMEREHPTDKERDYYIEGMTSNMEQEWENLGGSLSED
jgi:hypothetical protein